MAPRKVRKATNRNSPVFGGIIVLPKVIGSIETTSEEINPINEKIKMRMQSEQLPLQYLYYKLIST